MSRIIQFEYSARNSNFLPPTNFPGDAHAEDGFCSAIRKAEVVGEIKGDRFVASSFKLLPVEGHDEHEGHKH